MEENEQNEIAIAFFTLIICLFFSIIGAGISSTILSSNSAFPGLLTGLFLAFLIINFFIKKLIYKGKFH